MNLCNYPVDLAMNGTDGVGGYPARLPVGFLADEFILMAANHGDSEESETWMNQEIEYHAGHVHEIEEEEFFNRYFD